MAKSIRMITRRCSALSLILFLVGNLYGQQAGSPIEFPVKASSQRLEMIVNSTRILTLHQEIPRAMVNNPELVRVVPLAPNKIQLSAMKAGVTQVNLWDEEGNLQGPVDVVQVQREVETLAVRYLSAEN